MAVLIHIGIRGYVQFHINSSFCWSLHYDTIYAHQDRLYDEQIGLFSTALKC